VAGWHQVRVGPQRKAGVGVTEVISGILMYAWAASTWAKSLDLADVRSCPPLADQARTAVLTSQASLPQWPGQWRLGTSGEKDQSDGHRADQSPVSAWWESEMLGSGLGRHRDLPLFLS
jgi:hypothetical protein